MTVGELLSKASSKELTEWLAFYKIEHDEAEAARLAEERKPKQ
jgi:hypothetical protein